MYKHPTRNFVFNLCFHRHLHSSLFSNLAFQLVALRCSFSNSSARSSNYNVRRQKKILQADVNSSTPTPTTPVNSKTTFVLKTTPKNFGSGFYSQKKCIFSLSSQQFGPNSLRERACGNNTPVMYLLFPYVCEWPLILFRRNTVLSLFRSSFSSSLTLVPNVKLCGD